MRCLSFLVSLLYLILCFSGPWCRFGVVGGAGSDRRIRTGSRNALGRVGVVWSFSSRGRAAADGGGVDDGAGASSLLVRRSVAEGAGGPAEESASLGRVADGGGVDDSAGAS